MSVPSIRLKDTFSLVSKISKGIMNFDELTSFSNQMNSYAISKYGKAISPILLKRE
jgi:hypothetical protein